MSAMTSSKKPSRQSTVDSRQSTVRLLALFLFQLLHVRLENEEHLNRGCLQHLQNLHGRRLQQTQGLRLDLRKARHRGEGLHPLRIEELAARNQPALYDQVRVVL